MGNCARLSQCLAAAALLAACSGSSDVDRGEEPAESESVDAASADTEVARALEVPSACRVPAEGVGPHEVEFRYSNASGAPIAISLGGQCGGQAQILSCASGYEPLGISLWCDGLCPALVGGCISGACEAESTPVLPEAPGGMTWSGVQYVLTPVSGGECWQPIDAPAGRYRIRVPIYPMGSPGYDHGLGAVEVDFTLPDADGIVHVPLDGPLVP